MNTKEALAVLRDAINDEAKAVAFFEARRWADSPACPRCGSVAVRQIIGKDGQRERHFRWKCADCKRQYSVRTGTVFEETRLPLRVWAHAYWRCCASKKGVSALQIQRETGIGYRAALFMLNRIRFAMADGSHAPKLTGIVEADETYVGGKPRSPNGAPAQRRQSGGLVHRAPVLAAVQRGGKVRVRTVPMVTGDNIRAFLRDSVDMSSRLVTDELHGYVKIGREFRGGHDTIHHGSREYARGDVTTNTIEGFFSLVKRKFYGTHHAVSREHLHRYIAEAAFIYNARKVTDAERVALAVKVSEGKRLTYREQPPAAA